MEDIKLVSIPSYTMDEAFEIFRERADMNEKLLEKMKFSDEKRVEELRKIIDELKELAHQENDGSNTTHKKETVSTTHDDIIAAHLLSYTILKERRKEIE